MENNETFTYAIGDNLYLNLTSRCTNACTFCVRNGKAEFCGYKLWLAREPSPEEVLARIPADITRYKEYVFCGFGEPTLRLDALLSIGRELKRRGATVRLNTNGQADLIHKRDVSGELASAVDKINVSLNEATADAYAALCNPAFGEAAFSALQTFAANCAKRGIDTWLSVVDILGQEKLDACRKIAAACGVPLKVRPYIA